MILIIDNYDSFTYNLVQYLGEILLTRGLNPDAEIKVVRNDELSVEALVNLYPHYLVVSPGPCTPRQAGISVEAIKQLAGKIPILGVCLGHQSIGAAFGGEIIRAKTIMHGKTSAIYHNGINLFKNLPNPFIATRYHSLVIKKENIPFCLEVTATTEDGEIMAVQHRNLPVYGVQFHPESILTTVGKDILRNFLNLPVKEIA
ncbi:MAG: anthranilate/aminodeoxychorismate synthase component II [Deltaproteobacteria bacterium RIFCSPLOWO2_12_FULL_40_28]|nr:MAG: anthranilate/aminodeoxychorismate synthase component II [Deltaproteobacteria bacterium RIFCSPHIGHO2_02_FULL_40_28]OGQ19566.1 MAG: anthranilate/aminodeoxychorismate synthase component II [Deltaproteobacteria bacterium RIFCSPHIGHO2_12_FULL_40_32]OGQ40843.1 MAG: anthranilate/aminodeoxychorismate synthase component II [Deltaproteobacteria bacterium RIFCSPLOWO2_02_FULL_40_36]OGQ53958.1 MAG: anthranilate/aminodeoxychorismate synthase component II [Deltaproteobacteria bacterium RIFCSPLOWO2_12_F